ncbi:putative nitrate transporter NarT [Peptococcaceae bacterium CEB3]|nr:putative nitrate transporter NarT [Peptococcaceae bacterium CEB3]
MGKTSSLQPSSSQPSSLQPSPWKRWYALILATLGMAATFALWSALSPLAPLFQQNLHLSNTQISILIAIPVLLGSLMRIPMGMLTDRFGGKKTFLALLVFSLLPALALGTATSSYSGLLFWAFILGMTGTSFAIGIPMVSKWFPPESQGLALGLFGMGNGGTALAGFLAPKIARTADWHHVFLWFSLPVLFLLVLFLFAQDAPGSTGRSKSWTDIRHLLKERPLVWVLSLFYFVTFGGFVAFANYIPKLTVDLYHLTKTSSGSVAALFVIMATIGRPLGGWLSDRLGAKNILYVVFILMGLTGLTLATGLPLTLFTVVIYALGFFAGIGNGAVFKLVPFYFAGDTGLATGIVGASGGLGGFFPPLFMGVFRDHFGSYTPGFILLSVFALTCIILNLRLLKREIA